MASYGNYLEAVLASDFLCHAMAADLEPSP